MSKQQTAQVNVRLDDKARQALSALRRLREPIPTASDIVREALMEKFERDANGKHRNGK